MTILKNVRLLISTHNYMTLKHVAVTSLYKARKPNNLSPVWIMPVVEPLDTKKNR